MQNTSDMRTTPSEGNDKTLKLEDAIPENLINFLTSNKDEQINIQTLKFDILHRAIRDIPLCTDIDDDNKNKMIELINKAIKHKIQSRYHRMLISLKINKHKVDGDIPNVMNELNKDCLMQLKEMVLNNEPLEESYKINIKHKDINEKELIEYNKKIIKAIDKRIAELEQDKPLRAFFTKEKTNAEAKEILTEQPESSLEETLEINEATREDVDKSHLNMAIEIIYSKLNKKQVIEKTEKITEKINAILQKLSDKQEDDKLLLERARRGRFCPGGTNLTNKPANILIRVFLKEILNYDNDIENTMIELRKTANLMAML